MLKVAALMWLLVGTVIAGVLATVVLTVPSLSVQAMKLFPIAGVGGYVLAVPFAWVVAKKVMASGIAA